MKSTEISEDVSELIKSLEGEIHPRTYEIVDQFLKVGEYRVAIEHLCELLCEDEVFLEASAYQKLISVVSRLGLDQRFGSIVPRPKHVEPAPE